MHPTYSPLRRRCGARAHGGDCQSPAGVPSARAELSSTRCGPRCTFALGGAKLVTASPMPQLWRHGLRQQTEEPTMLTWSSYFDPSSRARVILEVSIVTIGSGTSFGRGARAGLDGVNAQLRAREEEKCNHDVVRKLLETRREITLFSPHLHVSLWSNGTLNGGLSRRSLRPSEAR